MMRVAIILTVLALAQAPAAPQPGVTPADLARRLQARYESIRDFSADFTHAYEGGVLRKRVTERGTVLIKKPGMMRWTYTSPERKEFVSDGRKLYSYIPQDKQVFVSSVPTENSASTPALFLSGKGNMTADFSASYADVPEAQPDVYALKLDPRRKQQDYEWLILVVDRESLQLRQLVTIDQQGGRSVFTFTNFKENVGLRDAQFTFQIPRGVDVIMTGEPPK
jgi:outer membrane lipoprotein carrier protein